MMAEWNFIPMKNRSIVSETLDEGEKKCPAGAEERWVLVLLKSCLC